MAIPILNHLNFNSKSELQNAILHKTTSGSASDIEGKIIYDTGSDTVKYYDGSAWISLTASSSVTVSDNSGSTAMPVVFNDESNNLHDDTGAFTYKPSTGEVIATTFTGTLTGNVTGNVTGSAGSATGNAATATALATARTIGGVSFDGTADISLVSGSIPDNAADTSGNADTATLAATSTLVDAAEASTTYYPALVDGLTGAQALEAESGFNFVGNTGILTATGFAGNLTGNVTGNADTVTTNANLTGHVTSTGNAAVLGSFTSAQLATALTNETGSGSAVFATSPTLVTPALGTPASGVMTNVSGTAASLTAGAVTNGVYTTSKISVLAATSSSELAGVISDETGSGALVFATSPTLVTPVLGTPASGTLTNCTFPSANINTDINVNIANLTERLPEITESVTIGDATDVVVTTSGNLVVTGDLTVSGDTITANVGTLTVEDKNIVLNYHASSDTSSTANGSGITIQDAVDASNDATILWDATNDEFDFSHKITVPSVAGSLIIGGHTVDDIDITSEASDADDHLMTALAIKNRVEDYGYTTDANVTHRPITAGGNSLANSETLAFTAGSNVTITESAGAVTITSTDTTTNTQLATAAALIDVSAMAGNSVASFTHSLASKNLIVQMHDTTSGLVVHADVDHTSTNAIAITFAQTGAQLVTAGIGDIRVVVIDAVNGVTDKTVSYS
jgi:hypothetical protein